MSLWESKLLDSLTFCVLILKLVVSYTVGVDLLLFYLLVIHKSKTADSLQKSPQPLLSVPVSTISDRCSRC